MPSLTAKQCRFVLEYCVDLNATQAAIRAGYSQKTAASIGLENLRKPLIAKYVADELEAQANRTALTAELVIAGLRKEATETGNPASVRVAAWGWLGKHLAMFTDKVQHDGAVPTISISVRPEGEPVNRLAHLTNGDSP